MASLIVSTGLGPMFGAMPGVTPTGRDWSLGGERTMYELAAAAAASGHRVELRGNVTIPVAHEVCTAAGVEVADRPGAVALPLAPRATRADDVLLLTEGVPDPLVFARVLLGPARPVLLVLAPPGLFGWDFLSDRTSVALDVVQPRDVGRPESLAAAAALGFALWTNNPVIVQDAHAQGVSCTTLGTGLPGGIPSLPRTSRTTDVLIVGENRWAGRARTATEGLDATIEVTPMLQRDQLLQRMARARVLLHIPPIEGGSRIGIEARAMGAVPVMLRSNRFALGADEASGAVMADSAETVGRTVRALLDDPERLRCLSETGRRFAVRAAAWDPFVERVDAALRTVAGDPAQAARAEIGRRLRRERQPDSCSR